MKNDQDRVEHWNEYYSKVKLTRNPSPFCVWVFDKFVRGESTVIEFGCGNARDTFHLAGKASAVIGIDSSAIAIDNNQKQASLNSGIYFVNADVSYLNLKNFDLERTRSKIFYSRFFIHAISLQDELALNEYIDRVSNPGDLSIHEFRTPRDRLFQKGHSVSGNESIEGHYRRFVEPSEYIDRLNGGWNVIYLEESDDFAVMGSDKPTVVRIVAERCKLASS